VRILRSAILTIREEVYVEAAHAIGVRPWKIMSLHILPGAMPVLIVQETFLFAYAILAEAGISFVGVGVQPPFASWGNILSDATTLMSVAPWNVFAPGLAIVITVLALNLIGDGLRELLDPKRQKGKARS
jgi:peptide/nickel transport system permease protein